MNKSALLVALITALLATVVGVSYADRVETQLSGGERVELLHVTETLERSETLSEQALAVRKVPMAYAEDRAVRPRDLERVLGLPVANRLTPGQTLLWTDLEILQQERRDLSSLVQPGKRAFTIQARGARANLRLIQPGDYVDVLGTVPGSKEAKAVVLLQRVLVLAVGDRTTPKRGDGEEGGDDQVLTLSLNLRESQLVSLAERSGALSVVLRNPDDQRIIEDVPDLGSGALIDKETRGNVQRRRPNSPVRLLNDE